MLLMFCGLLNTLLFEMPEPFEMLFGMWTLGGPVNHVLGGHLHPPMGRGAFGGTYLGILAVDILNVMCKGAASSNAATHYR